MNYLFLDGDHSHAGVRCDFEIYGPMVRKGGIIVFHDIVEGTPERMGGLPAVLARDQISVPPHGDH